MISANISVSASEPAALPNQESSGVLGGGVSRLSDCAVMGLLRDMLECFGELLDRFDVTASGPRNAIK